MNECGTKYTYTVNTTLAGSAHEGCGAAAESRQTAACW